MKCLTMTVILACIITFAGCAESTPYHKAMVKVDGGNFILGQKGEEKNPPRQVMLHSFLMAKYLVTIGEWKQFLADSKLPFDWNWSDGGTMVGTFQDTVPTDDCPAQGLNWYYAIAFCNWASKRDGLEPCYSFSIPVIDRGTEPEVTWNKKANGYRLPTEAEWEYAARGGQTTKGYKYAGSNDPADIGKFMQKKSYPVGQFKPNELGLYDMGGDVSVWCWDWYDIKMYEWLPRENPSVDDLKQIHESLNYGNKFKVVRGNDWEFSLPESTIQRDCYAAVNIFTTGIRLVRNSD